MRSGLRGLAACTAVAAVAASLAFAGPTEAAPSRAFVARARAFPVEPDPGQNETSFAMRPVAAELGLANPPVAAFGRATVFDAGFAENQFSTESFPPDESFARCDTVSPNVPDRQSRETGTFGLSASCDETPAGAVEARGWTLEPFGLDGGAVTSAVRGDGGGDLVWVEATSVAHDVAVGPLSIATLRFVARAEAGGAPGTAATHTSIDVAGAEVNGVPVTLGAAGVTVDGSQVPAPLVPEATAAVQEAFAQGGYSDIRTLHPEAEAADDGTAARVDGGAMKVYFQRSDDPADREFVGLTLLGARVEVALGDAVGGDGFDLAPFTAGGARAGAAMSTAPNLEPAGAGAGTTATPSVNPSQDAESTAARAPGVDLATATVRRRIAGPSSAWIVALVVALAAAALAATSRTGPLAPVRRRAEGWWETTAEGFLRG